MAQSDAMNYIGAFTFNGISFALGAMVLIPIAFITERNGSDGINKTTVPKGIATGMVLFIAVSLQQIGVKITVSPGKSGFITGLYIILVPILGRLLGKKTNKLIWISTVLACIGMYLFSAPDPEGRGGTQLGNIILFAGAFFWAIHVLVTDRFAAGVKLVQFSIAQFLTCSVLSLAIAFIFEDVNLPSILEGYVPILFNGLFYVGISHTLQTIGQRHVEPSKAAVIFSTDSLFSVIGGAVLLGDIMTMRSYAGCAFIFTGIIISQINEKATKEAGLTKKAQGDIGDNRSPVSGQTKGNRL